MEALMDIFQLSSMMGDIGLTGNTDDKPDFCKCGISLIKDGFNEKGEPIYVKLTYRSSNNWSERGRSRQSSGQQSAPENRGMNQIHLAIDKAKNKTQAQKSLVKRVKSLLQSGIDVNAKDINGFTALHYALIRKADSVVELLLKSGADPNIKTAVVDGEHEEHVIETDSGMFEHHEHLINPLNEDKLCPIHIAAEAKNLRMIKLLIEYKADLEQRDLLGKRPIHYVADDFDCLRFLLNKGAKIDQADHKGLKPVNYAARSNSDQCLKLLLDHGSDADHADKEGMRPIHQAVGNQSLAIVSCLIDHGININAKDDEGYTPLHFAGALDNVKLIDLLLDAGADVDLKDDEGKTPYLIARQKSKQGKPTLILATRLIMNKIAGLEVSDETMELLDLHQSMYFVIGIELRNSVFDGNTGATLITQMKGEIAKMKSYNLCDSLTLHDIFITEDPRYRLNETVTSALKLVDYKEYPKYANMMRKKFSLDERRNDLIPKASKYLGLMMKWRVSTEKSIRSLLPDNLAEIIVAKLKYGDLKNLIRCGEQLEKELRRFTER